MCLFNPVFEDCEWFSTKPWIYKKLWEKVQNFQNDGFGNTYINNIVFRRCEQSVEKILWNNLSTFQTTNLMLIVVFQQLEDHSSNGLYSLL